MSGNPTATSFDHVSKCDEDAERVTDIWPVPLSPCPMQRRTRVSMLIEEEGLRYGTIVRIAYWLGVSPSTIRRDIATLMVEGDLTVNAAVAVTHKRTTGKRRKLRNS